ncbi:hypothetical protein M378DRAFT_167292 [Amanita muscaria Koide BX008]|uniref:C2H2-type domain-containing protein n=1 Tax=Amanita muscaria (strain Koide BX008) TaxID=946122 RepID=A0A0C2WWD8_AMAMK|nr:hypothetical protein M378DRAFT_167292 [Amanita muscaria Koide BX008]
MSYECVHCSRLFNTDRGVLAHCRAKGHGCYQCDLCDDGDIFKNNDELAEVSKALSSAHLLLLPVKVTSLY